MSLRSNVSNVQSRFQRELFPAPAEETGPLPKSHKCLVRVPDLAEAG